MKRTGEQARLDEHWLAQWDAGIVGTAARLPTYPNGLQNPTFAVRKGVAYVLHGRAWRDDEALPSPVHRQQSLALDLFATRLNEGTSQVWKVTVPSFVVPPTELTVFLDKKDARRRMRLLMHPRTHRVHLVLRNGEAKCHDWAMQELPTKEARRVRRVLHELSGEQLRKRLKRLEKHVWSSAADLSAVEVSQQQQLDDLKACVRVLPYLLASLAPPVPPPPCPDLRSSPRSSLPTLNEQMRATNNSSA